MYQPATSATASAGGDKEMLLQLLVAQLRYQDPSNPADSGEFLAQSAQFTALEKMQDVADQTAALLSAQVSFGATGMVGKTVTYLAEDGTSLSGLVQSVTYDANGPMLVVDGASVSLGMVQSVGIPPTGIDQPTTPDGPSTPGTGSTDTP
jgi:flagellar basal-body rod modification protein FlgD